MHTDVSDLGLAAYPVKNTHKGNKTDDVCNLRTLH